MLAFQAVPTTLIFLLAFATQLFFVAGDDCAGPVRVSTQQLRLISSDVCPDPRACEAARKPFSSDGDCSTADEAAAGITAAFEKFNVRSTAIAAASIANMISQSKSFQFNHNRYTDLCPDGCNGEAGSGTKSMITFNWLINFSLNSGDDTLSKAALAIDPNWANCKDKLACKGSEAQVESHLALVNTSDYTFATSVWFITNGYKIDPKCSTGMLQDLTNGNVDAYQQCLGKAMPIASYFGKAQKALTCSSGNGSTEISESAVASHVSAQPSTSKILSGNSADSPSMTSGASMSGSGSASASGADASGSSSITSDALRRTVSSLGALSALLMWSLAF